MARRNECRRAAALLYSVYDRSGLKTRHGWYTHGSCQQYTETPLCTIHECVCCVLFVCLPPDVSIRKVNTAVPPSRFSAPHKDVIRQAL